MGRAKPPIWAVIRAHVRASPRKTGILIVLVVVMIVVYARTFLKSGAPSEADASVAAPTGSSTSPATGSETVSTPERVSLSPPLPTGLTRNPFAVHLERFPIADGAAEPPPGEASPVEVLAPDPNEEIRAAASELLLQAIYYDESPLACINGEVVSPGREIAGFVVQHVEPTRVVLRRGRVDVALNLR